MRTKLMWLSLFALAACSDPSSDPDTDVADTDVADIAAPDTAAPDTATPDTAMVDTAAADSASSDTATDSASSDTAAPDTAAPDTATPDTATPDTATDTAAPDTATSDTATDTAAPDTAIDTATSDTSPTDTLHSPDTASPSGPFTFSTLAGTPGSVIHSVDGTGDAARLDAPRGVALDASGNLYVADTTNNTVRKVTPSGAVTTLAGSPGTAGFANANGSAARFNEPWGLTVSSSGDVFLADASNNAIRKITPAGMVTTIAGGGGPGCLDGAGAAAKLDEPRGVAIDAAGNLYVADYDNHVIRKITAGQVTTLAGSCDTEGNADGSGSAARFRGPHALAVDQNGNVYVADTGNRSIRKITPTGLVSTVSSGPGTWAEPRGIAVDATGVVYVADYGSHTIKSLQTNGAIATLAGMPGRPGAIDGIGSAARFHYPSGVAVAAGTVYVADTENDLLRTMASSGATTTLAGKVGQVSSLDGPRTAARFEDPFAVAVTDEGIVYVADSAAHIIRRISLSGDVTTYAGSPGAYGTADGNGSAARFYSPFGVAVDAAGNVYVADSLNATVRKIAPGGVVTTLAGSALQKGQNDGTGAAARFDQPFGIAVDAAGNVYVTDARLFNIRKITPSGQVTTLAGSAGQPGAADGTGTSARFLVPYGLTIDGAGNLYVADHGNHTVRKVTSSGVVTTLAGTAGMQGQTDATGAAARFRYLSSVASDPDGNVYVADTDNQTLRLITPDGVVTTIGGSSSIGATDGVGTAARFYNPKGIAIDASGVLYIADRSNHAIRIGER